MLCDICGSTFENSKFLNKNKIINDPIRFLHTCPMCRNLRFCKNCNKQFKHHQNQTCSKKCATELKEKTYLITQGASHNLAKGSKARVLMEKHLLNVHGVTNVFQRADVKESIMNTMLTRYKVNNISKLELIKDKKKITLNKTLANNPNLFLDNWWNTHSRLIKQLGYDPRLGMFGKASKESLLVLLPIFEYCINLGFNKSDLFLGIDGNSEYFINTGKKTYFYDFCLRSKHLIIEFQGIGFHANPIWNNEKLTEWRAVFTKELSSTNIKKTLIKNQVAKRRGFKILELWSDVSPETNIELAKLFIQNNL